MIKKIFGWLLMLGVLSLPTFSYAAEEQSQNEEPLVVEASVPSVAQDPDMVIKEQLEAIRARNDRTAYELNAESVKSDFEDPQSFMRALRREKPSLYDHVSYEILKSTLPDSKFHKVQLTDRYGEHSIAMFKMEHDEQGAWRIGDIIMLSGGKDPI